MEVICAGWGRTGTLSLKMALDELGLPCYHMTECFKHKDHAQLWIKAADGQPVDLKQLLSGYKATTDWPAVTFYKQLMALYPEAKVVLAVRDPNKWYASMKETVWEMSKANRDLPWYVALMHKLLSRGPSIAMVDRFVWEGDLQGCFQKDPAKAKRLFKQHMQEVMQAVPADRLLVFEVSQGWGPLCDFLGKPVPDKPFPHANDREHWQQLVAFVRKLNAGLTYGVPAAAAVMVAAAVGASRWWLRASQ